MAARSSALSRLPQAELLDLAHCELGLQASALDGLSRLELIDLLRRGRARRPATAKAILAAEWPRTAKKRSLRVGPDGRTMPATVAELPPSPLVLDERLVLLCRDAQSLFCYWTLEPDRLSDTLESVEGGRLALRLEDLDAPEATSEFACHAWARSWYLPVLGPSRQVRVELGVVGADGSWRELLRSNAVHTPAGALSSWEEPRYAEVDNLDELEGADRVALASTPAKPAGPAIRVGARGDSPIPDPDEPAVGIPPAVIPTAPADLLLPAQVVGPGPLVFGEIDEEAREREPMPAWLSDADPSTRAAQLQTLAQQLQHSGARNRASERFLGASERFVGAEARFVGAEARFLAGGDQRHQSEPIAETELPADDARLALVLHAHLPFVRHPEHDVFLEEEWLYEAISETYIPLLSLCERLAAEEVPYRLTLALSPTLVAMLRDPLLCARYERHLAWLRELCRRETVRARGDAALEAVVAHYEGRLAACEASWRAHNGDLTAGFAALALGGQLDLLTCGATHGYLPILGASSAEAVHAQLAVAVEQHERVFGVTPSGIWLPECAFAPGLDEALARVGLRYFVADSHAIAHAEPRPAQEGYAPIVCPESGVAVFPRDPASSEQVWSRELGYPGDPLYRDFYRDIGWDLPTDRLAPLPRVGQPPRPTGLKYHRITGHGADADKALYDPEAAAARAREHARHFVACRREQLGARLGRDPIDGETSRPLVVAPYDAELFGHWWYEGPLWLEEVLRACAQPGAPATTHLEAYLAENPRQQLARPATSSWGAGGYHAFWIDDSNAWIYPELSAAAARMTALARRYEAPSALARRALNQAARELLLAQSSDWAFLIKTGTAREYAEQRTRAHLERFARLATMLDHERFEDRVLVELEQRDNLFAGLDYRVFA